MGTSVFKYIFKYSKKQQIILLIITLASFPTLYLSLDLPKTIINDAIGSKRDIIDFFGFELDQISYLLVLCGIFLALVFVNGGFKYFINVYRGVMAERMLRRLRYMLVHRLLRFPQSQFRTVSSGEIVSMVALETEPLGGFFGDAFSLPAFQGGTLLTILVFMFVQDPILGAAAIALYPLQTYIIPKLQRQVNLLGKQRVQRVRKLSERLGEVVAGAQDIQVHDTSRYELADFSQRLGDIFDIRFLVYRKKFFIKFLNNFIAQLTPFFFFSIGGYLVISGDLSFGALVAILAAYKDLSSPWKELLAYYQRMEDSRIKFTQVVEQFNPPGMMDESLFAEPDAENAPTGGTQSGALSGANLSLVEDDDSKVIESASFAFKDSEHVAIVGPGGGGKNELARLMARLMDPTGGRLALGDAPLATLPQSVIGRNFAYVDQDTFTRSGTIRDNLFYGVKHQPVEDEQVDDETRRRRRDFAAEANASGNSPFDVGGDWIDYDAVGARDPEALTQRALQVLRAVGLEEDIFNIGLRKIIDPAASPEITENVLKIRSAVRDRLEKEEMTDLVEAFDLERFNLNASVGENILFGTPVDAAFETANLAVNPYVTQALEKVGLSDDFVTIGEKIAALMIDLFRDLPPGHEFFERFGFIEGDDLPEFQRILTHIQNRGHERIDPEDRLRLVALTFQLVPARHRLGVIDEPVQVRLVEARRAFAELLPEGGSGMVEFFNAGTYNAAANIIDNILFGKIASDKPDANVHVDELVTEVLDDLGMFIMIVEAGLDSDVGIGGKRLSALQRRKLAMARALLKRPQLLILNEATAPFDADTQALIRESIAEEMAGRTVVSVESDLAGENSFDRVFTMARGRLSEETAGAAAAEAPETETPAEGEEAGEETGSELQREARLLRSVPFFEGLTQSALMLLAFTAERKVFAAEAVLMRQGDMGEYAYVIVEGTADVIIETVDDSSIIAARGRGDLIGELALICDAPRTATLKARDEVTALRISRDVFFEMLREHPQLNTNLLLIIARRFEATMRRVSGGVDLYDSVTRLPVRQLMLGRVRDAAQRAGEEGGQPSSLIVVRFDAVEEIAEKLGPATEPRLFKKLARRLRGEMQEANIVARVDRGVFCILAPGQTTDAYVETLLDNIRAAMVKPLVFSTHSFDMPGESIRFEVLPADDAAVSLLEKWT